VYKIQHHKHIQTLCGDGSEVVTCDANQGGFHMSVQSSRVSSCLAYRCIVNRILGIYEMAIDHIAGKYRALLISQISVSQYVFEQWTLFWSNMTRYSTILSVIRGFCMNAGNGLRDANDLGREKAG
jgi:hypothetical protein